MQETRLYGERNSPEMNTALERLSAERIRHKQTSEFQIKVGPFNFYPDRETIYMDGDQKARPKRGLENFLALIAKVRARNPRAFEYASARKSSPEGGQGTYEMRFPTIEFESSSIRTAQYPRLTRCLGNKLKMGKLLIRVDQDPPCALAPSSEQHG